MKRGVLLLVILGAFLFGFTTSASAALFNAEDSNIYGTWDPNFKGYFGTEWSGYFIGLFSVSNNMDNQDGLEYWAKEYLEEFSAVFYDRWEWEDGSSENGFMSVTGTEFKDDNEAIAGTWSVSSPYQLGFYSVFGGRDWALYYVDPYLSTGIWTTVHITVGNGQQPELSHLSGIGTAKAVPEPATMLLLGFGLIGLAVVGRRNFRK